ncbi:MAG: Nif3-like dinuclear metal center hexameric protein, partial [Candidatus Omnitrophica bacterium]|nr:Nif3-like dinuclear metal center hexameric protein [Candidatus Omnitrophota bacterium]
MICHESLWLPEQQSDWYDSPKSGKIYVNENRKNLLDHHGLAVYRSHSNWDALRGDGVPDQAVSALNLGLVKVVAEQKFFRVLELPEPLPVGELFQKIEEGLGFRCCRLFGDPSTRIQRFAFLIGGFGENQWHMPQAAHEMGAEAVILGEMSEFIVMSCLEMGMPVIETLHSISEIPAIRRQAEILSEALPDLPVHHIPSGSTVYGCRIRGS